jgi:O-antigen/teichoic acid export membrane protein
MQQPWYRRNRVGEAMPKQSRNDNAINNKSEWRRLNMPQENFLDNTKNQIIKDSSKFITSTYLGSLTGLITGILTRKFLGPTLMGIWTYLKVIQHYTTYSQLGIASATEKEIPYYHGKKDYQKAIQIRNNAFTFTNIISFILLVIFLIYAFIVKSNVPPYYFYGLLTVAILASTGQYGLFYTVLLRAHKNISVLSKAKVIFSILWLLLVLLLVVPFNIYGLYIAAIILMLTNILYFYKKGKYYCKFQLEFHQLKKLFVIGMPIVLLSLGIISIRNLDRIFIVNMLGPKSLGYYSIAIMASNYVFTIPTTFSIVMFPRFQESFALDDNIVDIQNFVNTPTRILAYFMAIIIGFAVLILPPVVLIILPKYVEGITALKILLFGTFFISLTHMSNQFLITLNKQLRLTPVIFTLVAIACLLNYFFITWNYGINGVAMATAISYFLYYLISLGYAMLHYAKKTEIFLFMLENLFPLISAIVFLLGIDHFFPIKQTSIPLLLAHTSIRLLIFAFLSVPLLWHINRKTKILSRFFQLLIEKLPSHS